MTIVARLSIPDGWYCLKSAGTQTPAPVHPGYVANASDAALTVTASRPGDVELSIDVFAFHPSGAVPEGWDFVGFGQFRSVAPLQVETAIGTHGDFTDLSRITVPARVDYRLFRRYDDSNIEKHNLELTYTTIDEHPSRLVLTTELPAFSCPPARTFEGGVQWEVACPHPSRPEQAVSYFDVAQSRVAALEAIVATGRVLLARESRDVDDPSGTQLFIGLDRETTWVGGFGDRSVPDDKLAQRVDDALGQRPAAVAISRDGATQTDRRRPETISEDLVRIVEPRYGTKSSNVSQQWDRISSWLSTNIPRIEIVGGTDDAIAAAADRVGGEWPAELVDLYGRVNGFAVESWIELLPNLELFDLDTTVAEWETTTGIWRSLDQENDPDRGILRVAGVPSSTFVEDFVPIAGRDGNFLVVDTRPGDLQGCVTAFDKVDSDSAGPLWVSVSALLDDLATALETGRHFNTNWRPTVVDGTLVWNWG